MTWSISQNGPTFIVFEGEDEKTLINLYEVESVDEDPTGVVVHFTSGNSLYLTMTLDQFFGRMVEVVTARQ